MSRLCASIIVLLLVTRQVASQQLCYYAPDKLASSVYSPCGQWQSDSFVSCCKLGDNCLEHGICFSRDTGMTYVAGCTHSDFEDPSCNSAQSCGKGLSFHNQAGKY